jgi:thiamine kinase-like enzyme
MHDCNDKKAFLHLGIKHENFVFTDPTETEVKIIDFGST